LIIGSKVVAKANECNLKVVKEIEEASFETFRDILASGEKEQILQFFAKADLIKGEKGFNFSDMYWLLENKEMFTQITEILRERKIWDQLTWQYAFKHRDEKAIKECLQRNNHILHTVGTFFETSLIKCDPSISGF